MIAGGGVRAVLELGGVRDILAKSLGTTNPINMLKATVDGLQRLRRPDEVARTRGKAVADVLPYRADAEAGTAQAATVRAEVVMDADTAPEPDLATEGSTEPQPEGS